MQKQNLTYDWVKNKILSKGYKFFEGEYNVNHVGIRSLNKEVDNWDDFFCLLWQENGVDRIWVDDQFTTDPGIYYMEKKLLNPKGCGILMEGQYRGLWKIGNHKGYEAFVQVGKAKAYRDRNMDNIMDMNPSTIEEGYFGCDQHHGYESIHVGNNSAMCQVHRHKSDLEYVLSISKSNIAYGHGDTFTYTLLNEKDFVNG